jgi:hypothetical protein
MPMSVSKLAVGNDSTSLISDFIEGFEAQQKWAQR